MGCGGAARLSMFPNFLSGGQRFDTHFNLEDALVATSSTTSLGNTIFTHIFSRQYAASQRSVWRDADAEMFAGR